MVFTNKYTQTLMETFPSFAQSASYKQEHEIFDRAHDNINTHAVFTALTNYVSEELVKDDNVSDEEKAIYRFVNKYRNEFYDFSEGTDEGEFDGAICTCFLENLLNRASRGDYNIKRILPYLQGKSIAFCREWDKV